MLVSDIITNEWVYKGRPISQTDIDISDYEGFVYIIKNINDDKSYIGKKTLWNRTKKKVQKKDGSGTKNSIVKKESDWKKYWGSNTFLKEDVKEANALGFTREVLHFFKTKGESNYVEALYQFKYNVLLYPDKFYNQWIMVKVNRSHLNGLDADMFIFDDTK